MARYSYGRTSKRDRPGYDGLSHRHDSDPDVPLPCHGSHSQGQAHDGDYAPHDLRSPLKPGDCWKGHPAGEH
jgi:hypothetical protein